MWTMARTWFAPLVVVTALIATGCSSGKKHDDGTPSTPGSSTAVSPNNDTNNLVAQVFAAVGAAQSFHVVGDGKDNDTSYRLDVHFGDGGGSGYYTQGSARFDVAGHGSDTYVKTAAANWRATIGNKPEAAALAAQLAPHWVRVPTDQQAFAQLLDYVNKAHFVQSYQQSAAAGAGPFRKEGQATVNGTAATVYVDTKDNSKIYVAASGPPLLLKVDSPASDGGGGLTITDYNKPFSPTMPASNEVVDYTSIVK
jgi:hypothetical protein